MKNLNIISTKNISASFKLKDMLNKKILALNGEVVGKVKDIAFDAQKVYGIYVNDMLIDMTYIDQFKEECIVLKINPITNLKGKIVFDKDGKKLGIITEVIRTNNENSFVSVNVKKYFFSKTINIPKSDMAVIDKNIILNKII
jgi:sporulation protein YlmC with PRC-barrel domain